MAVGTFTPFTKQGEQKVDEAPTTEAAETTPDSDKKETKKIKPRDYRVLTGHKGNADQLKAAIDEAVKDGKGEVFIVVGKASGIQPRLALGAYARDNGDVNGKYVMISESFLKELTVASEPVTKRKVSVS